jgi:hypothetical protein
MGEYYSAWRDSVEGAVLVHLARYSDQWRDLVNTEMNVRGSREDGKCTEQLLKNALLLGLQPFVSVGMNYWVGSLTSISVQDVRASVLIGIPAAFVCEFARSAPRSTAERQQQQQLGCPALLRRPTLGLSVWAVCPVRVVTIGTAQFVHKCMD